MASGTTSQREEEPHGRGSRMRGDSPVFGAIALGLVLLADVFALFRGGRSETPVPAVAYLVCGPGFLSVLNLFFVARDVSRGRREAAWVGLALSLATIAWLTGPTWLRWLAR